MSASRSSKSFWNRAARDNAAWHVATSHNSQSDEFFASGRREVDSFLNFAGLGLNGTETLLEIGCGVGRMTRRLAALADRVIASDVSEQMLEHARENLTSVHNVDFVELSGEGDLPFEDASINAVFSYITMQHVPSAAAQERYFAESLRVVAPGGWVYLQFRRSGLIPRLLDWVGHLAHLFKGRRTLSRAWRGSRVKTRSLLAFASDTVTVDILPSTRRHIWVVARKRSASAA